MTIIQLSDLPIEEVYNKIQLKEDYERHNVLYGYDVLKESQWNILTISNYKKTFLNRVINGIGFRFGYTHLVLQLKCLKQVHKADLIYCHILQLTPLLSILKKIGILKIPVIAISHDAFSERATSLNKILELDKVIFFGKKTLEIAQKKNKLPKIHNDYIDWGVDMPFYTEWIKKQTLSPTLTTVVASGCANRDYDLLIDVFKNIPELKLYIFGRDFKPENLSNNIIIDNNIDINNVGKLRLHYYNCLAVAIPLKIELDWCNGTTVLLEAMTMSKAVIMTESKANLIDIEKEGIGILVKYGDINGWQKAIKYLQTNPEIAKKMGEKGFLLASTKYNYKIFCKQLVMQVSKFDKNIK